MISVDQLRALVSDPPFFGQNPILEDEIYEIIASMETNIYKAAGNAARSLAAYFAQKVTVTAGPVKIDSSAKCDHYLRIAKQYDDLSKTSGISQDDGSVLGVGSVVGAGIVTGIVVSEMDNVGSDSDRYGSAFTRGLDDADPEAMGEVS